MISKHHVDACCAVDAFCNLVCAIPNLPLDILCCSKKFACISHNDCLSERHILHTFGCLLVISRFSLPFDLVAGAVCVNILHLKLRLP